jgi:hypothetical protein
LGIPVNDRLNKLAQKLDRVSAQDDLRVQREKEIEALRRAAALELHSYCARLVNTMNQRLRSMHVELSPPEFALEDFREGGANLFQINAAGRVIQIRFQGTEPLISTENWKTPYTLEGNVHWFNQSMLDRDEVMEHQLYYCLEKRCNGWRYYDWRTHKSSLVDAEYMVWLLEQIV